MKRVGHLLITDGKMKDQSALDVGIDATARAQGSCTHPDSAEQMTQHIKQAVRRATSGRVHNLDVTVTGTHILQSLSANAT